MSYTFEPIGWVRLPFTDTAQIPKGLGAEHRTEGVLEIDARFETGLADSRGSPISSSCGSSIGWKASSSRHGRRPTIDPTACSRRAHRNVPIQSA